MWLFIIWSGGMWCAAQEPAPRQPAARQLASSAPSGVTSASATSSAASSASNSLISPTSSSSGNEGRLFFPQNFARGYVDFEMAPPHNEIDLGLCVVTTADPKSSAPSCNAFARYAWSGYLEMRPFGRTPLQRTFVFVEPKIYGGDNMPQQSYTASGSLILWEHTLGVGIELPRGFELRLKNHSVGMLGRYSDARTLRTDGPYGLYTTIGVRWNFGGFGSSGRRE